MAEPGEGPSHSPQKRLKSSALLSKQTAEARAIQFLDDFYGPCIAIAGLFELTQSRST